MSAPRAALLAALLLAGCPSEQTVEVVRDGVEDARADSSPALDLGDVAELSDAVDLATPDAGDAPADAAADSADEAQDMAPAPDAAPDLVEAPCPAQMALVGATCMDRFEAPNIEGARPLVMYSFLEAEAWCEARGKRLCFDDEWRSACEGAAGARYPYGDTHRPGVCRDEARWRAYNQTLLNGWPSGASGPQIGGLDALLAEARTRGAAATRAADHIEALYQGAGSGAYEGCTNEAGVMDLTGNVEEWTRRRDGGAASFHGNLKGRYWAETRTCQSNITTHGDTFRFYEIGFRCCQDAAP
jgi:formylglycine-generating enzyme required for sulfatase activity